MGVTRRVRTRRLPGWGLVEGVPRRFPLEGPLDVILRWGYTAGGPLDYGRWMGPLEGIHHVSHQVVHWRGHLEGVAF